MCSQSVIAHFMHYPQLIFNPRQISSFRPACFRMFPYPWGKNAGSNVDEMVKSCKACSSPSWRWVAVLRICRESCPQCALLHPGFDAGLEGISALCLVDTGRTGGEAHEQPPELPLLCSLFHLLHRCRLPGTHHQPFRALSVPLCPPVPCALEGSPVLRRSRTRSCS